MQSLIGGGDNKHSGILENETWKTWEGGNEDLKMKVLEWKFDKRSFTRNNWKIEFENFINVFYCI